MHGSEAGGFTLVEIVITMAITAMILAGVFYGYVQSARNLAWATCSLQAQLNAIERMEQTYSVIYKPQPPGANDQLVSSNFPIAVCTNILGSNFTYISDNMSQGITNQFLKMVRVDCVWMFQSKLFTNSISYLRAPDP
jgi:prepilin-type N-terminal cleavage/methylation domain-containing protein